MESFYQKNDSSLNNNRVNANHSPGTLNYAINTNIDTSLLKDGFSFYYKITAKDKGIIPEKSYSPDSGYYKCDWEIVNGVENNEVTPTKFCLSQNYPNPFNPSTVIGYQLPVTGQVSLKVYDVLGREVATLVNEYKPAGKYEVEFYGKNLPSGIYFYKLQAENFSVVKKMIIMK